MLTFTRGRSRFVARVAGIAVHDGQVLLHREEGWDFWVPPGGRVEFFETSGAALEREMREELGVETRAGRLIWLAESMFTFGDTEFHEIGIYLELILPTELAPERRPAFDGREGDRVLRFRWFACDELDDLALFPTFLRAGLKRLPAVPEHVLDIDRQGGGPPAR